MNFSGHETFPFRYSWLPKGYSLVRDNPDSLTHPETAMMELGLGKNMVRSLRYWLLSVGICDTSGGRGKGLEPTSLGRKLFEEEGGWDRFVEDPGTLWLLHWNLCSDRRRATTWYVAFSHVRDLQFTKQNLVDTVREFIADIGGGSVAEKTLQRDVDCFLRCYVTGTDEEVPEDSLACPLSELNLISRVPDAEHGDLFAFSRGPQTSLGDSVFLWCLVNYWDSGHEHSESLSFDRLAYAPGSPGMVLRLDDISLAQRLDRLEAITDGSLHFSESAGIRQLMRRELPDSETFLAKYYHAAS